jgi:hypothetical protein
MRCAVIRAPHLALFFQTIFYRCAAQHIARLRHACFGLLAVLFIFLFDARSIFDHGDHLLDSAFDCSFNCGRDNFTRNLLQTLAN